MMKKDKNSSTRSNNNYIEDDDTEALISNSSFSEKSSFIIDNTNTIPDRSIFHLCTINAFAFGYGFLISTFGLIVLPLESERLSKEDDDDDSSLLLAFFLALCGISQLVGPITGYISDRSINLKYGKRRPFLAGGAIVAILCLLLLRAASDTTNFTLYSIIFFIAMMALNVMYTAYSGAVTDLVNSKQRGLANGLMGTFMVLGGSAGFGCFSTFLSLRESYVLFAWLLLFVVLLSLWAYRMEETPATRHQRYIRQQITKDIEEDFFKYDDDDDDDDSFDDDDEFQDDDNEKQFITADDDEDTTSSSSWTMATTNDNSSYNTSWTYREIRNLYWIDRSEHYDFYLVFVSRTLYYMGVSVQTFMLFYFRDIVLLGNNNNDENNNAAKEAVSVLALIGQISSGIVCVPMGLLSDYIGGKRKVLLYVATVIIVISYFGFAFLPKDRTMVYVFGAIYGIGNGTYLSIDYALACDALPSKREAARYLGIWGVSCFIGTLCGPLLLGPTLMLFGIQDNEETDSLGRRSIEYTMGGYIAILMMGNIFMILGAILISYIKCTK